MSSHEFFQGPVNLFEGCARIFYERITLHCGYIMWVFLSNFIPVFISRTFWFYLVRLEEELR